MQFKSALRQFGKHGAKQSSSVLSTMESIEMPDFDVFSLLARFLYTFIIEDVSART